MRLSIPLIMLLSGLSMIARAQTTVGSGNWSTGSIWNGGNAPSGWTTINVGHTVTKSTGHTVEGTLNVNAAGNLTLTGDVTISGGSTINVYGNLVITGDLRLYGYLNIHPGGTVTVNGSTYVETSPYLVIGTSAAGPPYANMVIKQNLISPSGGDVLIRQNGRLAVFGYYSGSSGGGTNITVDDGGQAYIHGTITFTGGGDHLTNNNDGNPYYGFYSPHQPTYSGGGSGSNGTAGSNSVQGVSQIPSEFGTWLGSLPGSPLPVRLQYFKVAQVNERGIALEWATSMEENFSHFEVQRAGTDLSFTTIGIVQGKGGLEVKTIYDLVDDAPLSGKNYYRLKAIDVDNTFEYFNVIVADWSSAARELSLYPNPVVDHTFTVEVGDTFDQPVSLVVYEARGYVVYDCVVKGSSVTVRLPDTVAPGIYFARVSSSSKQQVVRVVVK